jgi:hypothetical protein
VRRVVALALLVPAAAPAGALAGSSTTADRFARLADGARGSGTLTLSVRFSADPDRCAAAGTCGLTGTVSAPLRLDPRRAARVSGGDVVVLPVRGTARARTRDSAAGRTCAESAVLRTAGLVFSGDRRGVLLRPGGAPDDAGIEDPFATGCRAPRLADLGRAALPALRLRSLSTRANRVTLRFDARRIVARAGFRATVTTRGTFRLTSR